MPSSVLDAIQTSKIINTMSKSHVVITYKYRSTTRVFCETVYACKTVATSFTGLYIRRQKIWPFFLFNKTDIDWFLQNLKGCKMDGREKERVLWNEWQGYFLIRRIVISAWNDFSQNFLGWLFVIEILTWISPPHRTANLN